jgi:hypothetical protein
MTTTTCTLNDRDSLCHVADKCEPFDAAWPTDAADACSARRGVSRRSPLGRRHEERLCRDVAGSIAN